MTLRKQTLQIATCTQTSLVRSSALSCSLSWTPCLTGHIYSWCLQPPLCAVCRGVLRVPSPDLEISLDPPALSDEGRASLQRPWVSVQLVPLLPSASIPLASPLPPHPPAIWAVFQFITCAQSLPTHGVSCAWTPCPNPTNFSPFGAQVKCHLPREALPKL